MSAFDLNNTTFKKSTRVTAYDEGGREFVSAWSENNPRCILGNEYTFHYRCPPHTERLREDDRLILHAARPGSDGNGSRRRSRVGIPVIVTETQRVIPGSFRRDELSWNARSSSTTTSAVDFHRRPGSKNVGTCRLVVIDAKFRMAFDTLYRTSETRKPNARKAINASKLERRVRSGKFDEKEFDDVNETAGTDGDDEMEERRRRRR